MTSVPRQSEVLVAREALGLDGGRVVSRNGALAHWKDREWTALTRTGLAEVARPGVFDFECLYVLTRTGAHAVMGDDEMIDDGVQFPPPRECCAPISRADADR